MPTIDGTPESRDADDAARKAFGELAIACMVMGRRAPANRPEDYPALVDHVVTEVGGDGFSRGIARRPDLFHAYLVTYATLQHYGLNLGSYRRRLAKLLEFQYVDALDRSGWGLIDVRHHLDICGLESRLPDLQTLYRRSCLYDLPAIPLVTTPDAYAITHIVFYLGDFGNRQLEPILQDRLDVTREYVALLLGVYAHKRNWDLTSELLIAYACLERRARPIVEYALDALCAAQDPSGYVPGPSIQPKSLAVNDLDQASDQHFWSNYHPTLVASIAASLWEDSIGR